MPWEQTRRTAIRRVVSWLIGDVTYAVVPILVLVAVRFLLSQSFADFGSIKEWSFANIVLFGVALRRFIRLKVDIQQNPAPLKVDTGIQLLLLCLIASVLTLTLVVLNEMEFEQQGGIKFRFLGAAQLILFFLALMSILGCVWAEDLMSLKRTATDTSRAAGSELRAGDFVSASTEHRESEATQIDQSST